MRAATCCHGRNVVRACAGDAADEHDQTAPLLKEVGDHLVAADVLVAKAPRAHHVEQDGLQVLLHMEMVSSSLQSAVL